MPIAVSIAACGLSPRGRGKPVLQRWHPDRQRSIPAWAGETHCRGPRPGRLAVYPRVGGGNLLDRVGIHGIEGLSPRGRGKPGAGKRAAEKQGSIPAWAGETEEDEGFAVHATVYPRVGGGNGGQLLPGLGSEGLSPRGRGKHRRTSPDFPGAGSIPAWAGETRSLLVITDPPGVYPRVGGGNLAASP